MCDVCRQVCETIVEIALDHKPSHCEMASVLISDLYGRIFSAKDIGLGKYADAFSTVN